MPFVNLWIRAGHDAGHKKAISDSIHKAMVEVLEVTDDDRFHNFQDQQPESMLQDYTYAGLARSGDSLFVQFYFTQRPPTLKQEFFQAVVNNLVDSPGLNERDIYLNIIEPAPENWWIAGRVVDPETGFDVRMADAAQRAKTD